MPVVGNRLLWSCACGRRRAAAESLMGSWVGRLGSRAYVVASRCGGGELFEMRQQRRDWFLYLVRIVDKKKRLIGEGLQWMRHPYYRDHCRPYLRFMFIPTLPRSPRNEPCNKSSTFEIPSTLSSWFAINRLQVPLKAHYCRKTHSV